MVVPHCDQAAGIEISSSLPALLTGFSEWRSGQQDFQQTATHSDAASLMHLMEIHSENLQKFQDLPQSLSVPKRQLCPEFGLCLGTISHPFFMTLYLEVWETSALTGIVGTEVRNRMKKNLVIAYACDKMALCSENSALLRHSGHPEEEYFDPWQDQTREEAPQIRVLVHRSRKGGTSFVQELHVLRQVSEPQLQIKPTN